MDDWFRHSAVDSDVEGDCEYSAVGWSSNLDAGYTSEWPVDRPERTETPVSDDEIWTPGWVLAGTIAVAGGSASGRLAAVALVRQLLSANLDRFRVLSEKIEASVATLSFQAATATQHEDWTLEAISAACHSASSLNRMATEPSVNASVVSLRTERQIAG